MEATDEILLRENPNRYVIFPINYHDIWEMYKKHRSVDWNVEEVILTDDRPHWENKYITMGTITAGTRACNGLVITNLRKKR